jgi:hypothetical protein
MSEDETYTIPFNVSSGGTGVVTNYLVGTPTKRRSQVLLGEKKDVPNKEVEKLLKGLMLAFENSSTDNYGVKRAKTTLTVTKTGDGKLELGLGLGPFKVVDVEGKLSGEATQGIEIEIERREVNSATTNRHTKVP